MIMVIIILLNDKKLRLSLAGIDICHGQSIWIETSQQYNGSEH